MLGLNYTDECITIWTDDGRAVLCDRFHPQFNKITQALREDNQEEVDRLIDLTIGKQVNDAYQDSGVYYDEDSEIVYLNGKELYDHVAERVVEHARANLPFTYLLNFIERLNKCESMVIRNNGLFDFIQSENLPITTDGYVVGYKSVTKDYKDFWTRTIDNSIGAKPRVDRRDVCDDRTKDCSYGLHLGNIQYALGYRSGSSRHIVLCKFDPVDAVCVPSTDCNKMRVCGYEVIGEYTEKLDGKVYRQDNNNVVRVDDDYEDEEDYDDEDDDDWYYQTTYN